jgi:hypothetical protein
MQPLSGKGVEVAVDRPGHACRTVTILRKNLDRGAAPKRRVRGDEKGALGNWMGSSGSKIIEREDDLAVIGTRVIRDADAEPCERAMSILLTVISRSRVQVCSEGHHGRQ